MKRRSVTQRVSVGTPLATFAGRRGRETASFEAAARGVQTGLPLAAEPSHRAANREPYAGSLDEHRHQGYPFQFVSENEARPTTQ